MIVTAGLLVAGMGSLALIVRGLRKAPEGYEDEHGFHIVRKKAVSRVFPAIRSRQCGRPQRPPAPKRQSGHRGRYRDKISVRVEQFFENHSKFFRKNA